MKNKPQKFSCIEIHRPHNKVGTNLVKDHKKYRLPEEVNGNRKVSAASEKVKSNVKLTHDPRRKKSRKASKRKNRKSYRRAFLALCNFPNYVENAVIAAILLLLAMLSQIADLLVGIVPALPVLVLNTIPQTDDPVMRALLRAIQGPEKWKGKGWSLRRPWIIQPKISLRETRPSQSTIDYIGGKFKDELYRWRKFCFPFICSSMVLMPGIPPEVSRTIISASPLALPILFGPRKKIEGRLVLDLDADNLNAYIPEGIEKLFSHSKRCHQGITMFLKWFYHKEKHFTQWKNDMSRFRPVVHKGQFIQPATDEKTELLCAALSFFQQYLHFASEKKGWISTDTAREILHHYWQLVLPESALSETGPQDSPANPDYDTPSVFYQFLTDHYIPTYRGQVLRGTKAAQGTMAIIYTVDEVEYFIAPRRRFLEVYAQWLSDHGSSAFELSGDKDEAAVQRKLLDAGIPLKGETKNPATWRYKFFNANANVPKNKIDCFGLPIRQLPETVQSVFGQLLGMPDVEAAVPNGPEPAPDGQEGVNPL